MSSDVAFAAATAATARAQVQMAVAARLARINAGSAQSVVDLIESAGANLEQAAKAVLPPGVGTSLDISA
jgi:hypothetical protein